MPIYLTLFSITFGYFLHYDINTDIFFLLYALKNIKIIFNSETKNVLIIKKDVLKSLNCIFNLIWIEPKKNEL